MTDTRVKAGLSLLIGDAGDKAFFRAQWEYLASRFVFKSGTPSLEVMMRDSRVVCLLLPFALADCIGDSSNAGIGSTWHALPSAQLQNVTAVSYQAVAGRPDCTAYSITGMLGGIPRTVVGTACRAIDDTMTLREQQPNGLAVVTTLSPATVLAGPSSGDQIFAGFFDDEFLGYDPHFVAPFGLVVFGGPFFSVGHHHGFDRFDAHDLHRDIRGGSHNRAGSHGESHGGR